MKTIIGNYLAGVRHRFMTDVHACRDSWRGRIDAVQRLPGDIRRMTLGEIIGACLGSIFAFVVCGCYTVAALAALSAVFVAGSFGFDFAGATEHEMLVFAAVLLAAVEMLAIGGLLHGLAWLGSKAVERLRAPRPVAE